jgi:hypothetical protein
MHRLHIVMALGAFFATSLLASPYAAVAQGPVDVAAEDSRTFGTASSVVYNIHYSAFTGVAGTDNNAVEVAFGSRRCTGSCNLLAPVFLPAGALITRIELVACDSLNTQDVTARLTRTTGIESSLFIATVSTGLVPGPGCNFFPADLATPETVDNFNNNYNIAVALTGTPTARFQAVRLYYTLQVSPAPGTATFQDVPTSHPFFRFIEALAAAGITGGCSVSPPLYCPDNAVTRGQMAVFIGRALGLHWAP